ncbi:hypothetical protein HBJ58_16925 [Halomonas desiderata]|uniref:toxin-antitoxin system YwqK family antitoxin n=1 Tax=Billgrantia desiderata TaxID=52021 RepID=UPI00174DAEE0|nr:hypothetical protein [Halomonas desiderata]
MSFFGDLRRTTKATVRAVSKGVELCAFAAEELDKSAGRGVLKAECYRLETGLRSLKNHQASSYEISDVRRQLVGAYRRALPEVSDLDRQSIASKLDALLFEESKAEIACVVDRIKSQRRSLQSTEFTTPASKIRTLKALRSDYVLAASLAEKISDKALAEDSRIRVGEIDADVVELEKLRYEVIEEKFASGRQKSVIRKYDGAFHGVSEYWYENGQLWKMICYQNGRPDGRCVLFRENGTTLIEVHVDQSASRMVQKIYLDDGSKIVEGILSRGSGEISVWLWNGVSLGVARYSDGSISRVIFVLGLLAKPKVWLALFLAYKNNGVREKFDEMSSALNEYAVFANEFAK